MSITHTITAAMPSKQPYPSDMITTFSSLEAANVYTLYNALLILINQFIITFYSLPSGCDTNTTAERSASEQISTATTNIVQSIHYHLTCRDPRNTATFAVSGHRNIYLLLPVRVAHRALSQMDTTQDASKRLWLEEVLDMVRGTGGPWMSNGHIFGAGNVPAVT